MATPKKERTPAAQARHDKRRAENEARAAANAERRARGEMTPHEIKRAKRKEARKPKQEAYKRVQAAKVAVNTRLDESLKAEQDTLATTLLRETKQGGRRTTTVSS